MLRLLTPLKQGTGAPAPFAPTDISGMQYWFDGADATSVTQSSGLVSQWADKSGNSRNALQAVGAQQPTFTAALQNGKSGLVFGGSAMTTPNITMLSNSVAFSVIMVLKHTTINTFNYLFSLEAQSGPTFCPSFTYANGGYCFQTINPPDGWTVRPKAVCSPGTTNAHILEFYYDGIDPTNLSSFHILLDGVDQTLTSTIMDYSNGSVIGSYDTSGPAPFSLAGWMLEIEVYNSSLFGTGNRTLNYNYLSTKWGI